MKIIGGNGDAVELREKIDQEIDQMMNSMKHVTETEIQLFLEEVVWDDEDWDDWMRWGEWWTEAQEVARRKEVRHLWPRVS